MNLSGTKFLSSNEFLSFLNEKKKRRTEIPTMDFISATRMISTAQTDEKEIRNRTDKVLGELIFDLV